MGGCACVEYLYGWVWVGVTVQITSWGVAVTVNGTFMGGCAFLKYLYVWV